MLRPGALSHRHLPVPNEPARDSPMPLPNGYTLNKGYWESRKTDTSATQRTDKCILIHLISVLLQSLREKRNRLLGHRREMVVMCRFSETTSSLRLLPPLYYCTAGGSDEPFGGSFRQDPDSVWSVTEHPSDSLSLLIANLADLGEHTVP